MADGNAHGHDHDHDHEEGRLGDTVREIAEVDLLVPRNKRGACCLHLAENEQEASSASTNAAPSNRDQALARASLIAGLHELRASKVNVKTDSTDGAAILMPQLARSVEWHKEVAVLVITSYVYHIVGLLLSVTMVTYLDKEESVYDLFGGQMYLCDFGANLDKCAHDPSDPSCTGPSGTAVKAPRLYGWTIWSLRTYVRNALITILPDKADEIKTQIDPGEYGVESYWCRVCCCCVFVLSIVTELKACFDLARLLWYLPNANQSWIGLKDSGDQQDMAYLDRVEVKVAGMSIYWKLWNFVFVLIPKILIAYLTSTSGIDFLMETADVDDLIVNTVALGFILGVDELIYSTLVSPQAVGLVSKCEPLVLPDDEHLLVEEDHAVQHFTETKGTLWHALWDALSRKFLRAYVVIFITAVSVWKYYFVHCEFHEGHWVSKEMHQPNSMSFTFGNLIAPLTFPVDAVSDVYWRYKAEE